MANPCYVQIHPTCIPQSDEFQSKLTLMSESLRNDGRVWVPKEKGDSRPPQQIPESERDYFLERKYPSFGNLVPRDVASRNAKSVCDDGRGVGTTGLAVYLDFSDAIERLGAQVIAERYGNLFQMYERITGDDVFVEKAMKIYPAVHYVMGGLWVDYNLMSNIPGLHVLGEANFSDHGANRLGASALMQGLADGYFIAPHTVAHYLANAKNEPVDTSHAAFEEAEASVRERVDKLLAVNGTRTVLQFHRDLGKIMWDKVGMSRNEAQLKEALTEVRALRDEFWKDVKVVGAAQDFNKNLEHALRVADYFEFGELLIRDALHRGESCGGHFREESQTEEGEAKRDDDNYAYAAAWEYKGADQEPVLHKEPLTFDFVEVKQRSYK